MGQIVYPEEAKRIPDAPIVSVIIPVFNTRKYLSQALNSVLFQSLRNVEVICIDDCSTDESFNYLKYRASLDKRLTVVRQKKNAGGGAARNRGLDLARGKYLYFLDSDDFIENELLERAVNLAEIENSQVVPFKVYRFDDVTHEKKLAENAFRSQYFPNRQTFSASDFSSYVFNTFMTWPHNKLFNKEFVIKNSLRFQEIHRTNDLLFVHSAIALAERITPLDFIGINYRVGMTSNSQSTNYLYPLDFCQAFSALKETLERKGLWSAYRSSFQDAFVGGAIYNLESIQTQDAAIELYLYLKDYALDAFEIGDNTSRNPIFDDYYIKCQQIRDTTVEDWITSKLNNDSVH